MIESCFICDNTEFSRIGLVKRYSLMECVKCRLQFLDPIPDEKHLSEIYTNYYKAWDIDNSRNEVSRMKSETFRGYMEQVAQYAPAGRLLDIGCATGELMQVAQKMGFDVYGLEISPDGIWICQEKFGKVKIITSDLKAGDFKPAFFDIVTLSDVLEHTQGPGSFLDIICNILKPGGVLMIITPDTSSWQRKIMRKYWIHYKEEHIVYYSRSNINKLLSVYFEIKRSTHAYKFLTLNYIASVLYAYSDKKRFRKLVQYLKIFPPFFRYYPFKINIGEMFILCTKKADCI